MKSFGTIALTFLTVLMFVLFIAGCGEDGVDGITGTAGCDFDQVKDSATGLCVHDGTKHTANHPKNGTPGLVGCDFDQVRDAATGLCVHDETKHTANHPKDGSIGPQGPVLQCAEGKFWNVNNGKCRLDCDQGESWYPDRGNKGMCLTPPLI